MENKKPALDLTEFIADSATIKWSGGEIIVPADAPADAMIESTALNDLGAGDIGPNQIKMIKNIIRGVLIAENEEKNVDAFFKSLSFRQLLAVCRFVFEYITGASTDEKQAKKNSD